MTAWRYHQYFLRFEFWFFWDFQTPRSKDQWVHPKEYVYTRRFGHCAIDCCITIRTYLWARKVITVESIPPLKRTASLAFFTDIAWLECKLTHSRPPSEIAEHLPTLRNILDTKVNTPIQVVYQIVYGLGKVLRDAFQRFKLRNVWRQFGIYFCRFSLYLERLWVGLVVNFSRYVRTKDPTTPSAVGWRSRRAMHSLNAKSTLQKVKHKCLMHNNALTCDAGCHDFRSRQNMWSVDNSLKS